MIKPLLATLASLVAALGTATAAGKAYTFGLVAKSQGNAVFQVARVGADDAARELSKKYGLNIKVDWRTPNEEDPQKQAEAIEQLEIGRAHF